MYNHFAEAEWKEFFVEGVTEILFGKDIYERERVEGKVPYITATANNNGIGILFQIPIPQRKRSAFQLIVMAL